jgi:hypothetical protein
MLSIEYKLCRIDEREYSFVQYSENPLPGQQRVLCTQERAETMAETDRNSDPTLKKRLSIFPSPAGISLTKFSLEL